MKRYLYGWAMIALVGLSACSKENPTETDPPKLEIRADIAAMTKAPQLNEDGSGAFASGDAFTVLSHHPISEATSTFDYQVGATEMYWQNLNLPSDQGTVDFFACYPTQSLADGSFDFDLEQVENPDLLLASTQSVKIGTESVAMTFQHAMHRLVVRFSTDPSYASAADIQTICTAKSTCRVNLRDGSIDNSSTRKASFTSYGQTATFLIVPQKSSDVSLTIHVGSDIKTIQLSDLLPSIDQLETGKQLSVSLSVKEGKVELEGAMIEGWGDQGSIDGSIIM